MKKYKRKSKNYNLIKISVLLVLFLSFMTIGYSLFTDKLYIEGEVTLADLLFPSCNITISDSAINLSDLSKTISLSFTLEDITGDLCTVQYSIDDGTTWIDYTGPFKIYQTTTIKARCIKNEDSSEIGSAEKEVRLGIAQFNAYNGNNTVLGFTGITKSSVVHITRASNDITMEEIQTRITNGENIQKLSDSTGGEDYAIYGWQDGDTFYWWSNADTVFFNATQRNAFRDLPNVETIDLTGMDTSKITSFNSWFWQDYKLKNLDLSGFNTSNATDMYGIFYRCESMESYDLSSFDTSNVRNFASMFGRNYMLTELDLSSFNTGNGTNMNDMFNQATGLVSLNVSSFNTANVTSMQRMFASCEQLPELDVSNFDTSRLNNAASMFSNMYKIQTIYASTSFVTSQITASTNMFQNDSLLVGGNGTAYNGSIIDKTYAVIDADGTPGYFTAR